ncbi:hypothetical protein EDC15_101124 [Acetobacter aceti NBRC 14818]|nr:hypothetical protein EDC15_101124 [Acetobacter aceti NBRC 14818]
MFCMLKIGFCENPVSTACGVTSQLKIFFEELLCSAPNANLRTITVKYMITIKRYLTVLVARASSAVASAGTMITVAHALYIHGVTTMPSWFSIDWSSGQLAEPLIYPHQYILKRIHTSSGKTSKEFRGAIGTNGMNKKSTASANARAILTTRMSYMQG